MQVSLLLHRVQPVPGIAEAIQTAFPFVTHVTQRTGSISSRAWVSSRKQYDARMVLEDALADHSEEEEARNQQYPATAADHASRPPTRSMLLIVTSKDCFADSLNFVFGTAQFNKGCIVSTYRLGNDDEFCLKECVHELGHVFGLPHCRLPCCMTFSNSVDEAHQKSAALCQTCLSRLGNYKRVYCSS